MNELPNAGLAHLDKDPSRKRSPLITPKPRRSILVFIPGNAGREARTSWRWCVWKPEARSLIFSVSP